MKRILLSLTLAFVGFYSYSQVVVTGISPASVQGNYDYGVQFNCGSWPDFVGADDGTWGTFSLGGHDFNQPGYYIQDTLALVEDGTVGVNAQGDPLSQEGCSPLINDLTGKIAVIYRGSCAFTQKVWNAEQAGAVAAIIISNVEDVNFYMSAGAASDGPNVTIPAVIIPLSSGHALVDAMASNDVVMFIGNKLGAFPNDLGSVKGEHMIAPYGGSHAAQFDGFDLGIQVYNYGANDQADVSVNASIDGPSGNVYNETVGPISMNSGDTAFIFNGNTLEFPTFNLGGVGNYPAGDYTITYSITSSATDDVDFDNTFTSDFKVQSTVLSRAQLDGSDMPVATNYPSNSDGVYQSCMAVHELNASLLGGVDGMYFYPNADTTGAADAGFEFPGTEIIGYAYEWTDTSLLDNANLIPLDQGFYYPNDLNERETLQFMSFTGGGFRLQDDKFYLFCLYTAEGQFVDFGWNSSSNNNANTAITGELYSPIQTDDQSAGGAGVAWYGGGWSGGASPAIGLRIVQDLGLKEETMINGSAYPNPAVDAVTVSIEAEGSAVLTITDVAGKIASTESIKLVNGEATVNTSNLETGVYIFTVTLENGQTSQFNVIKK